MERAALVHISPQVLLTALPASARYTEGVEGAASDAEGIDGAA